MNTMQRVSTTDGGTHEGTYYLISPSENSDEEWKYPVDSCSDAEDAWGLRHNGNYDSSIDLASRIKSRADELGCDLNLGESDSMTECDCGCDKNNSNDTMTTEDNPFAKMDNLTVDAVREQNDHVDEHIAQLESEIESLEDSMDDLQSEHESLQDERDALAETVEDHVESEKDALKATLTDSEAYEDEELADMEIDQLEMLVDAMDKFDTDSDEPVSDENDQSSVKTPTNDSNSDGVPNMPEKDFNPLDYDL